MEQESVSSTGSDSIMMSLMTLGGITVDVGNIFQLQPTFLNLWQMLIVRGRQHPQNQGAIESFCKLDPNRQNTF